MKSNKLIEAEKKFCCKEQQDEQARDEGGPFFGQGGFEPAYTLQKEEPQHRVICYLAAEGNTNTEISQKTGFTTAMVAYVKKQPWAQSRIAEIIKQSGREAVMNVLKGAALEAARTLAETAKIDGEVKARPEVRVRAANDLLNRIYGTAPQFVMHGKIDPGDLEDDELLAIVQTGTTR